MQVSKCNSQISFKRALTPNEKIEYQNVLSQARNEVNGGGKSILIVHDSCLPQLASSDVGVGHLSSKTSDEFFDFAKSYMGINTVEVLPPGEIQLKHGKGFYNVYNGSGLSLGTQEIDLELLTEPKYNSILPKSEFQKVVDANSLTQKVGFANYENVIGAKSPQENALKIAFQNFMKDESIDKTAYENYKKSNADWLEPKAIYPVLQKENDGKHWSQWVSEVDKTLFDNQSQKSLDRIAEIKQKHFDEIEFYKFKQFVADEHLKQGRQALNSKGMKLFGDCLIGFSQDETWAFKSAFKKDAFVGLPEWQIPALNYDSIMYENSASQKLLRRKVGLFAQRYDGIRFDCSWAYVKPKLSDDSSVDLKGGLLDIIEDTVKKVKGEKFDKTDLIHEFEADPKDFSIFGPDGKILPHLKERVKVISSSYMDKNYGSTDAMKKAGAKVDEFVIGVGNHDPQPLRQIAENIPEDISGKLSYRKKGQIEVLGQLLDIRRDKISTPADFSKAKFAEPLMAKNQMVFYMDAFGRAERFDSQAKNGWVNYRYRIPVTYSHDYENAVKHGFGYNPMDAYAKVFKAKGLDQTKKDLYSKIIKFRDILCEKTTDAISNITKPKKNLSSNKLVNIGAVVVALGLIGTVISNVNKNLQKQQQDKDVIKLNA